MCVCVFVCVGVCEVFLYFCVFVCLCVWVSVLIRACVRDPSKQNNQGFLLKRDDKGGLESTLSRARFH